VRDAETDVNRAALAGRRVCAISGRTTAYGKRRDRAPSVACVPGVAARLRPAASRATGAAATPGTATGWPARGRCSGS